MATRNDTLFSIVANIHTAIGDVLKYGVKKDETCIILNCKHKNNVYLYAAHELNLTIFEQLNNSTSLEWSNFEVHFKFWNIVCSK